VKDYKFQNRIFSLRLSTLILFVAGYSDSLAQENAWYLLKSAANLTEENSKSVMARVQELAAGSTVWYNGSKSQTFGCTYSGSVNWIDILNDLNSNGNFLADVTQGEIHRHGDFTRMSIFYQRARYYAENSDLMPSNFMAELNQEEWDDLSEESRDFYLAGENFILVDK